MSYLFASLGQVHTGLQIVRVLPEDLLIMRSPLLDVSHAHMAEAKKGSGLQGER